MSHPSRSSAGERACVSPDDQWYWARRAVSHVRFFLTIGSSTARAQELDAAGQCPYPAPGWWNQMKYRMCLAGDDDYSKKNSCISEQRENLKELGVFPNLPLYTRAQARTVAKALEGSGCGNCGEQAFAAFVYLMDHGCRSIELMKAADDHQFVVLGRDPRTPVADPSTWGPAVVCDPWKGQVYLAAPHLGRGTSLILVV